MGLFSEAQMNKIDSVAKKSNASLKSVKKVSSDSINKELNESSNAVLEYFSDAKSILINSEEQLHDYVSECIKAGIAGIDTETTGLDRIKDTIVGCSLYYPGGTECYIPNKHIVPLFDEPYKDQLTYEQTGKELQRLVDNNVKLIFANADFDLAMIYKDYHVDLCDVCYYDVIIAWRCIKEDEKKNGLKELYNKYVLKGKGEPMKFSDFFSPKVFPYCKPQIAKLYAANDAKITYELCMWQMPYITKGNKKCQKKHLEHIADLVWNIEFPLIKVCQKMHRTGSYIDKETAKVLNERYDAELKKESDILAGMVQEEIDKQPYIPSEVSKRPFQTGRDFKPNSNVQVSYLLYKMMKLTPPPTKKGAKKSSNESTSKKVLEQFNLPITDQIAKVRSLYTLISTFVQKMPNATTSDSRIHAEYKQIGADTGRFSSQSPNLQNIPSHANDIRHMFRATPETHQIIDVESNEEYKLTFEVSYYDKLYDKNNELVSVHDLKAGDFITVQNNTEDICLQIESREDTKSDLSRCNIILNSEIDNGKYRIKVQTPAYVMLSSDFSQQEPRMTAFISKDPKMIQAYQEGKDIYATIASIAMHLPYEQCLEFNPVTHEVQRDGKQRRTEAKSIVLGILYGRSTKTIGEQLYGSNITQNLTEVQKSQKEKENTKKAQEVYDSVLNAFPSLKDLMRNAQAQARRYGYTETILGRRRHLPDMTLPPYEFAPMRGYVNPDVDPLNPDTLENKSEIPQRIIDELTYEFREYKPWQVVKRTKELAEQKIRVINNTGKITDATRQCVNCVDDKTEILTDRGWLIYDEVKAGDSILSYNTKLKALTHDTVQMVHINKGEQEVYAFDNDDIDSVSTLEHRWVWADKYDTNIKKFVKTSDILHHFDDGFVGVSSQNIIRTMANVSVYGNEKAVDDMLAIIGWICFNQVENSTILLYGSFTKITAYNPSYIYVQDIDKISDKETKYFGFIRDSFEELGAENAYFYDDSTHCYVIDTRKIDIPKFNHVFISSLSQAQARLLYNSIEEFSHLNIMLRDSDILSDFESSIICSDQEQVDLIQHLLAQCGLSSYVKRLDKNQKQSIDVLDNYENLYAVFQSNTKTVEIQEEDIRFLTTDLTWCVTTGNGTWIARRNGKVYITGNSIVQGSAADLTKMAILNLCNNEEWQRLGGRLLTPIHDELLCEIPMENWERGGEVLTSCMCEAADFMPFKITCDVETTVRWYGNAFPMEYPKPESFPTRKKEEIKWVQWCLLEMEYILPIYKDKDGNTPIGDEGRGINGIISDEYKNAIMDYIGKYRITEEEFIDHIEQHAIYGILI